MPFNKVRGKRKNAAARRFEDLAVIRRARQPKRLLLKYRRKPIFFYLMTIASISTGASERFLAQWVSPPPVNIMSPACMTF